MKTLSLNGVSFSYGGSGQKPLIDNLSLKFDQGNIHVIHAPSGSGKTTLLNLIAKILRPDTGTVTYKENGKEAEYSVGYVFQDHTLIPWRTVRDNILLGAEVRNGITKDFVDIANDVIKEFGLNGYENSYPSELSGGMKQRVSILRTLVSDAKVILLDEPFVSLDNGLKKELQNELSEIIEKKKLIAVMVTHDWLETIRLANEINNFSSKPMNLLSQVEIKESRNDRKNLRISDLMEIAKQYDDVNGMLI